MQSNREEFVSEIYVNGEQANDAMEKLRGEVDKTAKAYEKLLNTKDADPVKTEKARKAWESATQSLERARKGTEAYDTAMKNLSGKSMENLLRMQRQIKKELDKTKPNTAEWNELAKAYQNVSNRIKSLGDAQRGIVVEGNKSTTAFGRFFNKVNDFYGGITVYAKAAKAGLQAIMGVTKQVVNASQTMGDKWNNGMAAMKTATEAFFMALSTGDWTAFNDGIAGALKKARELAEQLDLLGDYNISDKVMQSKYMSDFNAARVTATDLEASAEARQDAINKMEYAMNHYTAFVKDKAKETWEGLTDQFDAWKGIQFETAEEFESFFVHYYEYGTTARDETVENMRAAKAAVDAAEQSLQNLGRGMVTDGNVWQRATDRLKNAKEVYDKLYAAATKEQRAILAALELPDDKKNEAADLYASYTASLEKASSMGRSFNRTQKQANAATKENTTTTTGATEATNAYAEAIKKVDKAEKAQLAMLKSLYANGLMDKATYEAQKAVVEEDFLKQRLAVAQKYGKDTDQFMNQLLDRQIARMEKAKAMLKEEADEMARYYEGLRTGDERQFGASTGSAANGGIADQEAYGAFQEKIWAKANEIKQSLVEDSARTEYETQMKWIEKLHKDGLLSDEEFEKAKLDQKLGFAAKIAQEVNRYAEMASNFSNALKEAETAQLEAEYQKQLTAAGDNAEERERIEAEYEQKKLDLQKKYADIDMAINIAKTIANGAAAAIKAYMEGGPYAGPVLAALIAATTAAEVATIIAQRNAIKNASASGGGSTGSAAATGERKVTGYAAGGFTGHGTMGINERPARPPKKTRRGDEEVVGVVHANEWVAPAWMVRELPVVFANLEEWRQRGYGAGGYTGGGGTMGINERPARPPKKARGGYADEAGLDWEAVREFNAIMRYCAENGIFVKYGDILLAKEKHDNFKNQTTR